MKRIAAFGVGSTNFRFVLGTSTGEFLTDVAVEETRPGHLLDQFCGAIDTLRGRTADPLDAVSICTAGLIDAERGVIQELDTPDGDAVHDLPVRETIRSEFGLPTTLENDCNAATVGEYCFGAGDGYDSVVHVTMGTGIGAGIVEDSRLLRGEHGHAGEVGLISVAPDGALESFGVPGAWEAYCSGRGIPRYVRSLLADEDRPTSLAADGLSAEDVFAAAARGDRVASEYLDRIARYDAAGIGAIVNTCNPGIITLGGGVVLNNRGVLLERIRDHLDAFLFVDPPVIDVTPLGAEVGLYGALGRHADPGVAADSPALVVEHDGG